jgi:hypothetical protein
MASYQKYIMMGVSTLLLPLAKKVLKELISKATGDSKDDSDFEENGDFNHGSGLSDRRAG